jgi:hypothetical protein
MNGPNKLELLHCSELKSLAKNKHSSLLGPFVSREDDMCFTKPFLRTHSIQNRRQLVCYRSL